MNHMQKLNVLITVVLAFGLFGFLLMSGEFGDRVASAVTHEHFQSPSRTCDDCDGDGHKKIAAGGDDCDDSDPNRYPGRAEVCDATGHDEDCDPATYGTKDNDRDGFVDSACFNQSADGTINRGEDCDDSNRSIHPLAGEVCDGVDNNCNGHIDEGVTVRLYGDNDGDGFGSEKTLSVMACHAGPFSYKKKAYFLVFTNTDCDDENAFVHPGQFELKDGIDNNCDGSIDEEPLITKPDEVDAPLTSLVVGIDKVLFVKQPNRLVLSWR